MTIQTRMASKAVTQGDILAGSEGGAILTSDQVAQETMEDVLIELRKLNIQLHILTDTHIRDTEVNNA